MTISEAHWQFCVMILCNYHACYNFKLTGVLFVWGFCLVELGKSIRYQSVAWQALLLSELHLVKD